MILAYILKTQMRLGKMIQFIHQDPTNRWNEYSKNR
jgi:hypothetical protein